MAREIGMSCWPSGDRKGCGEQFNITLRRYERSVTAYKRLEAEAGAAGWCIGHFDGQGFYVCPDHRNTVYDPIRLKD